MFSLCLHTFANHDSHVMQLDASCPFTCQISQEGLDLETGTAAAEYIYIHAVPQNTFMTFFPHQAAWLSRPELTQKGSLWTLSLAKCQSAFDQKFSSLVSSRLQADSSVQVATITWTSSARIYGIALATAERFAEGGTDVTSWQTCCVPALPQCLTCPCFVYPSHPQKELKKTTEQHQK